MIALAPPAWKNRPRRCTLESIAFGQGCRARRDGLPCLPPFPRTNSDDWFNLADAWERGWRHTEEEWGLDVQGRWPVQPLPPIAEKIEEDAA